MTVQNDGSQSRVGSFHGAFLQVSTLTERRIRAVLQSQIELEGWKVVFVASASGCISAVLYH